MSQTTFPEIGDIPALLNSVTFMSLTTCADDRPWCSPVFYAPDNDLNFYWLSSPDAVHSRNIARNPLSTIVVYNSVLPDRQGFGLYLEGTSRRLSEFEEIRAAYMTSCRKVGREPGSIDWLLKADAPRAYYRFTPDRAWVNGVEDVGGILVDLRKEIALAEVMRILV